MEKVSWEAFAAFFGNLGRKMTINCSINFLCKLIIFRTGIGQHKDVSFAQPHCVHAPPGSPHRTH